jgi:hypothetical protein
MINFYEHIEDYLADNLSQADKDAFEAQLKDDNELAQSVDNQRNVIQLLRQSKLREQVQRNLAEAQKEATVVAIRPVQQWAKAAAIAGVIVTAGMAIWLLQKPSNQSDIAQQPTTPTTIDTLSQKNNPSETPKVKDWKMEEKKSPSNHTQLADAPTKPNKFQEPESGVRSVGETNKSKGLLLCESFFEKSILQNTDNQQDKLNFNQGIIFLEQKNYEEASRTLLKIEETSAIFGKSQWFLALSLLARERYDTAKSMLEDIAKDEKNEYQPKAKKILEKL